MSECNWCKKYIEEGHEVFGFGAKARPGLDLKNKEGTIITIPLILEEKDISVIVTAQDSDAKKDGHDLLFMTCSRKCGEKLKNALKNEKNLIEEFGSAN